jgi:hypothetical protein
MKTWVKIDRATGREMERKRAKKLNKRPLNKKIVWLELVDGSPQTYDPETEKIRRVLTVPDLSDLTKSVRKNVVATMQRNKIKLSQAQLDQKKIHLVASLDGKVARDVENLIGMIIDGVPLTKENLDTKTIERHSERKAARGIV